MNSAMPSRRLVTVVSMLALAFVAGMASPAVAANSSGPPLVAVASVPGTSEGTVDIPLGLSPAPVVFTDADGTVNDTYTVPAVAGLDYIVDGEVIVAGTYPGAGTVTVTARAQTGYGINPGANVGWTATFRTAPAPGAFVAMAPLRVLDTRTGSPAGADAAVSFQVGGVGGIPADVSAVVFNLTVTEAKSFGFVTAYASGTGRPNASNVNYGVGQTVPNLVTVPVGADGRVSLFNRSSGSAGLIADISGYFLAGIPTAPGAFQPMAPLRVLDTRTGSPAGADAAVSFQVGGVGGIPADVSAVVFNLTVTEAKSFGFVTAYASGTGRPNASNVNYGVGQTVPNLVTVPVGADGRVSLFNRSSGSAGLIADISGYFLAGIPTAPGAFQPMAPLRVLDTRTGSPAGADAAVSFQVGGVGGIPADVSAVVFNLTVTEAKSFGFVTAYASGTGRPNASNVNYGVGQTVPNLVTVPVGADGRVSLFNRSSGSAGLIADISGYFLPGLYHAPNSQPAYASGAFELLAGLPVKGRAPKTGYDRALFGTAWVDVDANGCDTRNDILQRDLTNTTYTNSVPCKIQTGTLADPYTGTTIGFVRGQDTSSAVQIDHVVALSDAWQKGAQQLSTEQRTAFANDPLNLQATDGPTNQQKGDGDAATWLPPDTSFRCEYVARQISVKATYSLWVTQAEHDAMTDILADCPNQLVPTNQPAPPPVALAPAAPPPVAPAPVEPAPVLPAPAPVPPAPAPYYQNCTAAREAGAAPLYRGQPGYRSALDRDGDGTACE
ncbi:GmrSD restriction endonuclease domain-containing protein [Arthrobacter sp. A5]|uniref:GmrSD restriction endonuclease domain-containing protein n=1 Tax=Arthrobacter sp. A5 TaxID=576926 RepID=UPI003DA98D47